MHVHQPTPPMAHLLPLLLLLVVLSGAAAQGPAAAPAPPGPTNITGVLAKAGQFATFIRLLRATAVADQIDNQLNNSNNGMTVFAPPDNAFTSLPSGALNSLSDAQKDALVQFHVLPELITMSQFETMSNPVRTQAGNSASGQYPLNVSAVGTQVNISTGVVNATVANTLYADDQLAVYQVDKVLLPVALFGPPAPAPAPMPPSKKKKKGPSVAEAPVADAAVDATTSAGARRRLVGWGGIGVALAAVAVSWGL